MTEAIRFVQAASDEEVNDARRLFIEYSDWLGINLCFQNFERELAELPGAYAPPDGRLLLAFSGDRLVGCVALRRIGEGVCEMKRLFVRANSRGKRIGRQLARKIIEEARAIGYAQMRLDTLPEKMSAAIGMYRSLGFREIEAYYHNPVEGALFMELALR